jgi:hypothetical protein
MENGWRLETRCIRKLEIFTRLSRMRSMSNECEIDKLFLKSDGLPPCYAEEKIYIRNYVNSQ